MNPIRVIITGSTGMVGKGVLLECLENPSVSSILVINRQTVGITHPKLKELVNVNFFDLTSIERDLTGYDACFFCLGVSAFRMKKADYSRITYDLTINTAKTLLRLNPGISFCYVSGASTDSTEKGKVMWARVKGRTENALLAMPFKNAYMFRPGYIHPMFGIKSKTPLYNALYAVLKPLYPVLKSISPNSVTTNAAIGKAMVAAVISNEGQHILDPKDINRLAAMQER
jgi:uncharacterized protein YbjT (DUF2867 family)